MTRVLNVNDREIPRYIAEEMLRHEGFDVTSVSTGRAAIDAAMAGDFEVALLDVQLPDLDGFRVCQQLRNEPKTRNIIILMSSATFVTSKSKIAGLESGADGYLVQPFEVAELIATLRSLLRAREAERQASMLARELKAAMDVRDEFLAMLGHELRNPIGALTTALHLIETKPDPTSYARYHDIMSRQTRNLSRIVDDLLDVARITRGKVSLEKVVVDLRESIQRCIDALASEITASKHIIKLEVPQTTVNVVGDPVRVEQIMSNLITNAVKYTPPGGTIIVRLSVRERAIIEVIDSGVGMSAEMRDHVFDLFVQGAQTIDRSRGGLGLGLTVVRQLVELHNGSVAAFSEGEGKGSRFVVELPLAPSGATAVGEATEVKSGDSLHIVVVEDNDDARETLEDALGTFEHRVASADNGIDGLALILSEQPDVALVDIGLPGLDGYEIARKIHERMDGAAPTLIAMTGYGQPEDRVRAMKAGFDIHIVKPVQLAKLKKLLVELPRRDLGSLDRRR